MISLQILLYPDGKISLGGGFAHPSLKGEDIQLMSGYYDKESTIKALRKVIVEGQEGEIEITVSSLDKVCHKIFKILKNEDHVSFTAKDGTIVIKLKIYPNDKVFFFPML